MHRLSREVRFCVDPFGQGKVAGQNSYSGRPCVDGYMPFFALWLELASKVDQQTGFVVNVSEIDSTVRRLAVPVFEKRVQEKFAHSKTLSLDDLKELLCESWKVLNLSFSQGQIESLAISVNPYIFIKIKSQEPKVVIYSEKFEFAAMHRLWNNEFSEAKNYESFGKCANPNGHGHNYIVEVQVSYPVGSDFAIGDFGKIVKENFIDIVDHMNLNVDVEGLKGKIPTVENITTYGWSCLDGKFNNIKLQKITVWESDRTYCSYSGGN